MIPLMNISSLDTTYATEIGRTQSLDVKSEGIHSSSSTPSRGRTIHNTQSPNSSLSGSIRGNSGRQETRHLEADELNADESSSIRSSESPQPQTRSQKALPPISPRMAAAKTNNPEPPVFILNKSLRPHVTSPNPEEFLLVVGTDPAEIGIGMFVNVDGDMTRPTIEFESYPSCVVLDGPSVDPAFAPDDPSQEDDCFVLASLAVSEKDQVQYGIEVQRWNAGSEAVPEKHWLASGDGDGDGQYGIASLLSSEETHFDSVISKLAEAKFHPFPNSLETSLSSLKSQDSRTALTIERLTKERELFERDFDSQGGDSPNDEWESARLSDGEEFIRRLAKTEAKVAVWSKTQLWWALRNPLLIRLDSTLQYACSPQHSWPEHVNKEAIFSVLASLRARRDAASELEFLTVRYIQQKASVLLLGNLLLKHAEGVFSNEETEILEKALIDSQLDPRVVLSLIPSIRNEIVVGRRGIWIYNGVKVVSESFLRSPSFERLSKISLLTMPLHILTFLRHFLLSWKKQKGFGSISDDHEVFKTVEASFLLVLLELDQRNVKAGHTNNTVRMELNELVDKGVDCFDRAVDILESQHRLFVLSRLYQGRKMSSDVLATWKRIMEGEEDVGEDFTNGERRVRDYLTKISSQSLVKEYGIWLAGRNPKLGVEVFAEEKGKAARFEPSQVIEILRDSAPMAVKYYLEHLIFDKGNSKYVNELISYYLDIVMVDLQSSVDSREATIAAYDAYRALQAPKPTYHHFLAENAPNDDEVWESRLRLLQLLGGTSEYDYDAIHARIAELPGDLLVPEIIILAARKQHHHEALRLLVQKLGDYDSAVSYCLRGGVSLFSPSTAQSLVTNNTMSLEQRRELFQALLQEFLAIEDISSRVEQTGALLDRFGSWFDITDILRLIPDSWSVDTIGDFLVGAMRRIVKEKHECMIVRSLSGSQNIRVHYERLDKMDGYLTVDNGVSKAP